METSNTKPMANTTVNESKRLRTINIMEFLEGLGTTCQMVLSARCICANTVVAPKVKAPTPIKVPTKLPSDIREPSTATATASAASGPSTSSSCIIICAMAASVLSTSPIMCTARITTGAIENIVKNAKAPAKINDRSEERRVGKEIREE